MPRPQVVGETQAAGIAPSNSGIASRRIDSRRNDVRRIGGNRLDAAVRRGMDSARLIGDILDASKAGDPAAVEIANRLMGDREFLRAMLSSLEKVRDELAASIAAGKATAPTDEGQYVNADPTAPGMEDPDDLRSTRGSGLPGTDSRTSSVYTKDQLMRDLATQTQAAKQIAITEGVAAADEAVARTPLVPPWDSPRWTSDAREAFRHRAQYDGWAADHIRGGGVRSIDAYLRGE